MVIGDGVCNLVGRACLQDVGLVHNLVMQLQKGGWSTPFSPTIVSINTIADSI